MGWFSRSWRRAGRRHPSPLKPDRTYRRAFHSALSNPRYRANQTHTATYQPIGTPASGRHCPPQAGDRCPPDSDAPLSSLTVSDSGSAHSQPPSPRRAGHRHPPPSNSLRPRSPQDGEPQFRPPSAGCADRRSAFPAPAALDADRRCAVSLRFAQRCRPEVGVPSPGCQLHWLGYSPRWETSRCSASAPFAALSRSGAGLKTGVPSPGCQPWWSGYALRPAPSRCPAFSPPPAFGGLCRPEAGVPSRPRASSPSAVRGFAPPSQRGSLVDLYGIK